MVARWVKGSKDVLSTCLDEDSSDLPSERQVVLRA